MAEADLDVECGKGAFMRVLAADLGDALGVGGLLSWLERTRYGCLELADAHTVDELREMEDPTTALLPPEVAISFLPAVFLGPPAVTLVRNGQPVFLPRGGGRPAPGRGAGAQPRPASWSRWASSPATASGPPRS